MSKRNKAKYPALEKGLNIKSRKDYIEVDYINGVKGDSGDYAIRPLNEDELEFLNKFYEETIVTNFTHDPKIKHLTQKKKNIIEDKTVQKLKKELKTLKSEKAEKKKIKEQQEIIKLTKQQNEETYKQELEDIEIELQELREDILLYPDREDHKQFYNDNNRRNSCLYNMAKKTYKLLSIDSEEYEFEERFSMDHDTGEDELIYGLERDSHESEGKRLAKAEKTLRKENKRK